MGTGSSSSSAIVNYQSMTLLYEQTAPQWQGHQYPPLIASLLSIVSHEYPLLVILNGDNDHKPHHDPQHFSPIITSIHWGIHHDYWTIKQPWNSSSAGYFLQVHHGPGRSARPTPCGAFHADSTAGAWAAWWPPGDVCWLRTSMNCSYTGGFNGVSPTWWMSVIDGYSSDM